MLLARLSSSDDGNYSVHVSNDFGSFTQDFSLNVLSLGNMRIAAGGNHFAFIDGKGSVWTTGRNEKGQLGPEIKMGMIKSRRCMLEMQKRSEQVVLPPFF